MTTVEGLLLQAIAESLRNDVTIMVALTAIPGDIVPLVEKADLRLRVQLTINLLDEIDASVT
jgi:hypothetical protein